jgi:hypothetical protein
VNQFGIIFGKIEIVVTKIKIFIIPENRLVLLSFPSNFAFQR